MQKMGSIPALGRSPGLENGNPLEYSCLVSLMDRGTLWGHKKVKHDLVTTFFKILFSLGQSLHARNPCNYYTLMKVKGKVAQSCLTLCDPMDCTIYGILQIRILEWVAFPFSRGSSQFRNQTQVSCLAGGFFMTEPPGTPQDNEPRIVD